MRIRLPLACAVSLCASIGSAETNTPLSAIDWLSEHNLAKPHTVAQPAPEPSEEPVTSNATAPAVTVAPLASPEQRILGLLPRTLTGLDPNIWMDVELDRFNAALETLGQPKLPAVQAMLFTVLLAETLDDPDPATAKAWITKRVRTLLDLGAVDPAYALATQADATRDPDLFAAWMDAALLSENEETPCAALIARPDISTDRAAQIYCTARLGDFETATLLYGTASALGLLRADMDALLARFLDPDLFEDLPRPPLRPDPLTFRLFEAAGAALATNALPRAFAHTNLREQSGWKAQLEAAERLTRAGALSTNVLLGLYTSRKPAASGGVWDRVKAWQGFDAALERRDIGAIGRSLPSFWRSMMSAGLEIAVADLFADKLAGFELPMTAAQVAFEMQLLSKSFETATPPDGSRRMVFLRSIAQGRPSAQHAETQTEQAVLAGLNDQRPKPAHVSGVEIINALIDAERGAAGNLTALTSSLTALRQLGLETVARQVALQVLILKDPDA